MLRGTLSQTAFGEPIGYRYAYVKNVEHGAKPSLEYLLRVAEYYNVSLDWILRGIELTTSKSNESSEIQIPRQKLEAHCDPELEQMCNILKNLMLRGDSNLRGWAIIQFKRAFSEYYAGTEEKNTISGTLNDKIQHKNNEP
ncbi:hypothetical protein SRRS_34200 [Sporomusa rhizae]|uniref:helix-turn-helix domain-containing protein n=1 Tax=Sporomusa rhizae TaxID=357999 RepID=UPI00352A85AD